MDDASDPDPTVAPPAARLQKRGLSSQEGDNICFIWLLSVKPVGDRKLKFFEHMLFMCVRNNLRVLKQSRRFLNDGMIPCVSVVQ